MIEIISDFLAFGFYSLTRCSCSVLYKLKRLKGFFGLFSLSMILFFKFKFRYYKNVLMIFYLKKNI